jgi:hypothetical protein
MNELSCTKSLLLGNYVVLVSTFMDTFLGVTEQRGTRVADLRITDVRIAAT